MPRTKRPSNLPAPIPGEPFSLIGTLRRCTGVLTADDCAELLRCDRKTIYKWMAAGLLPTVDLGVDHKVVDPAQLAAEITAPRLRNARRQKERRFQCAA